ncbi:MAG: MFS transporter [Thermodesulfovibrionales bacterium]|jgi:UMF1 family MFS transporter|nr:MFS transporter [Thermodesulfovibrionales bacterium]
MSLNKKHIISWTLFDFANSSYSAVIAAVVFPVYYVNVIVGNETGRGDLWWGRAISVSMAVVALSSPFLGGIADFGGLRKRFLFFYTALSVLAVASLSILGKGMIIEGFLLIVIANFGMEGGLVFYNSFLPRIAPRDYQGRVSAWGFMVGYAGSIISLLFALPLIQNGYFKATWFMIAVFFAVCSIPAFLFLPKDTKEEYTLMHSAMRGLRLTLTTLREIARRKEPGKFLFSYLLYEDGVSTVIVFSSIFAATTLGFQPRELIFLYLAVQATALLGSLVMAKPIDLWGPKKVIMMSLVLWTSVAVTAFFVQTKNHFWVIATCAGLGLGTVQAASRAFYTQFIPEGKEAEYFGLYSLAGKSSAVIGPIIFGQISTTYGSQRPAILSVAAFFLIGLIILCFVRGGAPNIEGK